VLLAAAGTGTREISRRLRCTIGAASKVAGSLCARSSGGSVGSRRSRRHGEIWHRASAAHPGDRAPPAGYANWTAPLLGRELGDIHGQYIWRFLRAQKIDLSGRKSWCESNDPEFVSKAADIVGLYMMPPDNAVVLSVDEKPSIQALERAQGYLKLPNGRAMTGQSHDYKRHGTTTLFAALEVATGKVVGGAGASSSSTS
jgi:hypothetical protein